MATEVIPGYRAMIGLFESMLPEATHDAGIWRPGWRRYRRHQTAVNTTQYSPMKFMRQGLPRSTESKVKCWIFWIARASPARLPSGCNRHGRPAHQFPNTDEGVQI